MDKIYLDSILGLNHDQLNNVKIKFNVFNGDENPIDVFRRNPKEINEGWMLYRKEKNVYRKGEIVLNLLKLDYSSWLLTSIKRITKELGPEYNYDVGYEAEDLSEYAAYFGRTVIEYHKSERSVIMYFNTVNDYERLSIKQILPDVFKDDGFPGYDNVCITRVRLKEIIDNKENDWINALQAQKGVYVITDTNTGKLYIGSAYGAYGILGRWLNYKESIHGWNKSLIDLYNKEGEEYFDKYFQYSIIEIFNSLISDEAIIKREHYWMQVFNTKNTGYNN